MPVKAVVGAVIRSERRHASGGPDIRRVAGTIRLPAGFASGGSSAVELDETVHRAFYVAAEGAGHRGADRAEERCAAEVEVGGDLRAGRGGGDAQVEPELGAADAGTVEDQAVRGFGGFDRPGDAVAETLDGGDADQ